MSNYLTLSRYTADDYKSLQDSFSSLHHIPLVQNDQAQGTFKISFESHVFSKSFVVSYIKDRTTKTILKINNDGQLMVAKEYAREQEIISCLLKLINKSIKNKQAFVLINGQEQTPKTNQTQRWI